MPEPGLLRPILGPLSAGRLVVLHYHRVLDEEDSLLSGMLIDRAGFVAQMSALAGSFEVVSLLDGIRMLASGRLPRRAVAVTFDDGYADNYRVALPVLQEFGLTATFFVSTGYLDGGCMFNDMVFEAFRHAPDGTWETGIEDIGRIGTATVAERRTRALETIGRLKYLEPEARLRRARGLLESAGVAAPDLMMSSAEVVALRRAGMDIGAHTVTHPILARLDDAEARREMDDGRRALEQLLDEPVPLFAYPNGMPGRDYTSRDVALARELGFAGAVSTAHGCAGGTADLFQLPRIGPWDRTRWRMTLRLLDTWLRGRRFETC